MTDHFVIATWARDAVIDGQLEALRTPMRALAEYDYAPVAPGGWFQWVGQMQQAADLISRAESLDAAATGVATMGRICGECHSAQGRGPNFAVPPREGAAPRSDTLTTRMVRHMWAADRLWEGLTGPSDEAWDAGAAALAHAPVQTPASDPPLPADFANALLEVRDLGIRAGEADTAAERADLYGVYLASCADCHAYGVPFPF